MDHLRAEIWDHIFRSGPQSQQQVAASLGIDTPTVSTAVEHEWFEILDSKVQIATGKPPSPPKGIIG